MKKCFLIALYMLGAAVLPGQSPQHFLETSHEFGESVYSTLSYTQRLNNWGLQSGIATIWHPQQEHSVSGITTQVSRFFELSSRYYFRAGVIGGNLKNCWEVGANVRAGAQGSRVGVAITARYSYLIDNETGGMDFTGIGLMINYRI